MPIFSMLINNLEFDKRIINKCKNVTVSTDKIWPFLYYLCNHFLTISISNVCTRKFMYQQSLNQRRFYPWVLEDKNRWQKTKHNGSLKQYWSFKRYHYPSSEAVLLNTSPIKGNETLKTVPSLHHPSKQQQQLINQKQLK
jgi:hypothetical protein